MPLPTPHVPDGLIDLMKGLAKEVVREKPENIYEFAAIHFEKLLEKRDGSLHKNYERFAEFNRMFRGKQVFEVSPSLGYICARGMRKKKQKSTRPLKSEVMTSFKAMESINEEDVYMDERYQKAIYVIQRYYRRYTAKKKLKMEDENPSPVTSMTAAAAAIIIQRTMQRLFSNKIKLEKDNSHREGEGDSGGNDSAKPSGTIQDDVDNVSEAASYTSSSTIQMLADSQNGRENRLVGRDVLSNIVADNGSTEFKEQMTVVAQHEPAQLSPPPSPSPQVSVENSEVPPMVTTIQPTESEAPPKPVVEAALGREATTEANKKSMADENGNHLPEKSPNDSPTSPELDDTSTAHIGVRSTIIGSIDDQNLLQTNTTATIASNPPKLTPPLPSPTFTTDKNAAHNSPHNYSQSEGSTPETMPASSPQLGIQETFPIRVQGNAFAGNLATYSPQKGVQIKKFEPDTRDTLGMYDIFYQDRDDPDFSDSLNESVIERDSLDNEDLDMDSLESSETMSHLGSMMKRELRQDDGSLYEDSGEAEQVVERNTQKSAELERVPTYLYGIHPTRTPIAERKNLRNRGSGDSRKIRREEVSGAEKMEDKSEEDSMESKESTSDESNTTQIENVLESNNVEVKSDSIDLEKGSSNTGGEKGKSKLISDGTPTSETPKGDDLIEKHQATADSQPEHEKASLNLPNLASEGPEVALESLETKVHKHQQPDSGSDLTLKAGDTTSSVPENPSLQDPSHIDVINKVGKENIEEEKEQIKGIPEIREHLVNDSKEDEIRDDNAEEAIIQSRNDSIASAVLDSTVKEEGSPVDEHSLNNDGQGKEIQEIVPNVKKPDSNIVSKESTSTEQDPDRTLLESTSESGAIHAPNDLTPMNQDNYPKEAVIFKADTNPNENVKRSLEENPNKEESTVATEQHPPSSSDSASQIRTSELFPSSEIDARKAEVNSFLAKEREASGVGKPDLGVKANHEDTTHQDTLSLTTRDPSFGTNSSDPPAPASKSATELSANDSTRSVPVTPNPAFPSEMSTKSSQAIENPSDVIQDHKELSHKQDIVSMKPDAGSIESAEHALKKRSLDDTQTFEKTKEANAASEHGEVKESDIKMSSPEQSGSTVPTPSKEHPAEIKKGSGTKSLDDNNNLEDPKDNPITISSQLDESSKGVDMLINSDAKVEEVKGKSDQGNEEFNKISIPSLSETPASNQDIQKENDANTDSCPKSSDTKPELQIIGTEKRKEDVQLGDTILIDSMRENNWSSGEEHTSKELKREKSDANNKDHREIIINNEFQEPSKDEIDVESNQQLPEEHKVEPNSSDAKATGDNTDRVVGDINYQPNPSSSSPNHNTPTLDPTITEKSDAKADNSLKSIEDQTTSEPIDSIPSSSINIEGNQSNEEVNENKQSDANYSEIDKTQEFLNSDKETKKTISSLNAMKKNSDEGSDANFEHSAPLGDNTENPPTVTEDTVNNPVLSFSNKMGPSQLKEEENVDKESDAKSFDNERAIEFLSNEKEQEKTSNVLNLTDQKDDWNSDASSKLLVSLQNVSSTADDLENDQAPKSLNMYSSPNKQETNNKEVNDNKERGAKSMEQATIVNNSNNIQENYQPRDDVSNKLLTTPEISNQLNSIEDKSDTKPNKPFTNRETLENSLESKSEDDVKHSLQETLPIGSNDAEADGENSDANKVIKELGVKNRPTDIHASQELPPSPSIDIMTKGNTNIEPTTNHEVLGTNRQENLEQRLKSSQYQTDHVPEMIDKNLESSSKFEQSPENRNSDQNKPGPSNEVKSPLDKYNPEPSVNPETIDVSMVSLQAPSDESPSPKANAGHESKLQGDQYFGSTITSDEGDLANNASVIEVLKNEARPKRSSNFEANSKLSRVVEESGTLEDESYDHDQRFKKEAQLKKLVVGSEVHPKEGLDVESNETEEASLTDVLKIYKNSSNHYEAEKTHVDLKVDPDGANDKGALVANSGEDSHVSSLDFTHAKSALEMSLILKGIYVDPNESTPEHGPNGVAEGEDSDRPTNVLEESAEKSSEMGDAGTDTNVPKSESLENVEGATDDSSKPDSSEPAMGDEHQGNNLSAEMGHSNSIEGASLTNVLKNSKSDQQVVKNDMNKETSIGIFKTSGKRDSHVENAEVEKPVIQKVSSSEVEGKPLDVKNKETETKDKEGAPDEERKIESEVDSAGGQLTGEHSSRQDDECAMKVTDDLVKPSNSLEPTGDTISKSIPDSNGEHDIQARGVVDETEDNTPVDRPMPTEVTRIGESGATSADFSSIGKDLTFYENTITYLKDATVQLGAQLYGDQQNKDSSPQVNGVLDLAATKIQSTFRGYQVRKTLNDDKKDKIKAENDTALSEDRGLVGGENDLSQAGTTIQSADKEGGSTKIQLGSSTIDQKNSKETSKTITPSQASKGLPKTQRGTKIARAISLNESKEQHSEKVNKNKVFKKGHSVGDLSNQVKPVLKLGKSTTKALSNIRVQQNDTQSALERAPTIQKDSGTVRTKGLPTKLPYSSDLLSRTRIGNPKKFGRSTSVNDKSQKPPVFDIEAIKKDLLSKKVKTPPKSGRKPKISVKSIPGSRRTSSKSIVELGKAQNNDGDVKDDTEVVVQIKEQGSTEKSEEQRTIDQPEVEGIFNKLKQEVDKLKENSKQNSAEMIQKTYRGYRTRRDLIKQQEGSSKEGKVLEGNENINESPQLSDTTEIQSNTDGKEESNKEHLNQAAATIQKTYKGYKTRKDISGRREKKDQAPAPSSEDHALNETFRIERPNHKEGSKDPTQDNHKLNETFRIERAIESEVKADIDHPAAKGRLDSEQDLGSLPKEFVQNQTSTSSLDSFTPFLDSTSEQISSITSDQTEPNIQRPRHHHTRSQMKTTSANALLENAAASTIQKAYRSYNSRKGSVPLSTHKRRLSNDVNPVETSDESSTFIGPDTSFDLSDIDSVEPKTDQLTPTPSKDINSEPSSPHVFNIQIHSDDHDPINDSANPPDTTNTTSLSLPPTIRRKRSIIEPTAPPLDEILHADDPKSQWYVGDELIVPTDDTNATSLLEPFASSSSFDKPSSFANPNSPSARIEHLNPNQLLTTLDSSAVDTSSTSSLLFPNDTDTFGSQASQQLNKSFGTVSAKEEKEENEEDQAKKESEERKLREDPCEEGRGSKDEEEKESAPIGRDNEEGNFVLDSGDPFSVKTSTKDEKKDEEQAVQDTLCENCASGIHEVHPTGDADEGESQGEQLEGEGEATAANAGGSGGSRPDSSKETHFDKIKHFVQMEMESKSGGDESVDQTEGKVNGNNGNVSDISNVINDEDGKEVDVKAEVESLEAGNGTPLIALIPPSSEDDMSAREAKQKSLEIEKDVNQVTEVQPEVSGEKSGEEPFKEKEEEEIKKDESQEKKDGTQLDVESQDRTPSNESPNNKERSIESVEPTDETPRSSTGQNQDPKMASDDHAVIATESETASKQDEANGSESVDTPNSPERQDEDKEPNEIQQPASSTQEPSSDKEESKAATLSTEAENEPPITATSEDDPHDGDIQIARDATTLPSTDKEEGIAMEASEPIAEEDQIKSTEVTEGSTKQESSHIQDEIASVQEKEKSESLEELEIASQLIRIHQLEVENLNKQKSIEEPSMQVDPQHLSLQNLSESSEPSQTIEPNEDEKNTSSAVASSAQDSTPKSEEEEDKRQKHALNVDGKETKLSSEEDTTKVEDNMVKEESFDKSISTPLIDDKQDMDEEPEKEVSNDNDSKGNKELPSQPDQSKPEDQKPDASPEQAPESPESHPTLDDKQDLDEQPEKEVSNDNDSKGNKELPSQPDQSKPEDQKPDASPEQARESPESHPTLDDKQDLDEQPEKEVSNDNDSKGNRELPSQPNRSKPQDQKPDASPEQARESPESHPTLDDKQDLDEQPEKEVPNDNDLKDNNELPSQPDQSKPEDQKPDASPEQASESPESHPILDSTVQANIEALIEGSTALTEAKDEPVHLPTENSSQEVIEVPCTKKVISKPNNSVASEPDESEIESTTTKADSTSSTPGYDEASENDARKSPPMKTDILESMTEKLSEPEATVARMQKRQASEHKVSIDKDHPIFDSPISEPIKPMQELQKSFSVDVDDDIILQTLQRSDTTRESSAQSESVIFGGSISHQTESEDTFNENFDLSTLHRMNTIATERSSYKPQNLLFKSVTIDDTVKYIDPDKSTEESGGSFNLDDTMTAHVRDKMMAYSVSEADSDYFNESTDHSNRTRDDFNISTALDTFPSTDTDTTIISAAATKIQAGARGFLTRRRLRRASMGTKSSLSEVRTSSFGNDAIGQSLDQLVEEEGGKRTPKAQYHRHVGVNSLPSALGTTNDTEHSSSPPTRAIIQTVDNSVADLNLATTSTSTTAEPPLTTEPAITASTSSETDVNATTEDKIIEDDDSDAAQVASGLEATLAARRLTLQRGDAMRNDSTPDDDSNNGKQVDPVKGAPTSPPNITSPTSTTTIMNTTSTTSTTSTIGTIETDATMLIHQKTAVEPSRVASTGERNYSDAATAIKMEKIKWFALRQNSMPVQIDSEVFRVLPKHMRKRIKSADGEKTKRIRLPRD